MPKGRLLTIQMRTHKSSVAGLRWSALGPRFNSIVIDQPGVGAVLGVTAARTLHFTTMIDENGSAAQTQPLVDIFAHAFFRALHGEISYHRHRLYACLRTRRRDRALRSGTDRGAGAAGYTDQLPPVRSR